MENLFLLASKTKLRFQTSKGVLSTEDLWDLNLQNLDSIYKTLSRKMREIEEESLLKTKVDTEVELQIAILKHIVSSKLEEKAILKARSENKEKREKLLSIMAQKQDQELASKSLEDLQKELDSLGND